MADSTRLFFGREREMGLLRDLISERVASLVVIKGRRRIGKSRLIEEFSQSYKTFNFIGLAPEKKITAKQQRQHFATALEQQTTLRGLRVDDWDHLFSNLASAAASGRVILVLDEINWMGSKDPTFLPKLKSAWDRYFVKNPKLILILSGSMSTWIEENILGSTGFFGRITLTITLEELPLSECTRFWGAHAKRIAIFEMFKVLCVTGGIPRYLELIRPSLTAEKNIERLCFSKEGILFTEFDRIFSDLFSRRSSIYKKIVKTLTHGSADQEKIIKELGYSNTSGVISKYLNDLVETGYLARDYTWHLESGQEAKLSHYRLKDNYLRFYLRYIEPRKAAIERIGSITLPQWATIIGLQFENLILNHRKKLYKALGISDDEIIYDNPYFQRKSKTHPGCQIDLLIQTRFNTLYLCEIKFSKSAIDTSVIAKVEKKMKNMVIPARFSIRPVLVTVCGVTDAVLEAGFFAQIVNFGELL